MECSLLVRRNWAVSRRIQLAEVGRADGRPKFDLETRAQPIARSFLLLICLFLEVTESPKAAATRGRRTRTQNDDRSPEFHFFSFSFIWQATSDWN